MHYSLLMDINMKNQQIYLLILCIFIFVGCPWKECISPDRSYLAKYTFVHNDSLQVGDTIWVSAEMICDSMFNLLISATESYCEQDFSFPLGVVKITINNENKESEGAISSFEFVQKKGRVYNDPNIPSPHIVNQVEFDFEDNKYELFFGEICKHQGKFYLALSNGGSFGNDKCDNATLINEILNEERGQDLFTEFRSPIEVTQRELDHIYCFIVN